MNRIDTNYAQTTSTITTWPPYYTAIELDPKHSEWRCVYCKRRAGREEKPSFSLCPKCGCSQVVRVATTKKPRFITVQKPTFSWTVS